MLFAWAGPLLHLWLLLVTFSNPHPHHDVSCYLAWDRSGRTSSSAESQLARRLTSPILHMPESLMHRSEIPPLNVRSVLSFLVMCCFGRRSSRRTVMGTWLSAEKWLFPKDHPPYRPLRGIDKNRTINVFLSLKTDDVSLSAVHFYHISRPLTSRNFSIPITMLHVFSPFLFALY